MSKYDSYVLVVIALVPIEKHQLTTALIIESPSNLENYIVSTCSSVAK